MARLKNLISVPAIAAEFPNVTESEFRLLGLCAYYGCFPPNAWTLTKFDGSFNIL